ncbi:hypothetical protein [Franconibacter helveticus]|uniref:YobI family P-loop NTPase n=1 Tax=Franconibacter helveticus TaxID=357240 RepID=UPI000DA16857|nr:hypothetical protein [Franconibacter helveticus]
MNIPNRVLNICKKLENKFSKVRPSADDLPESKYTSLTPKKIKDTEGNTYFKALRYALSQKDVRNIAVTGAYGAGKSTVLHSYMSTYEEERFISVSLAGFDMQGNEYLAKSHEVELSILQQILYKKNRDELPDSRIDRILNRNRAHIWRVFWSALSIIAPISGILSIIFHKKVLEVTGIPESAFGFFNAIPYPKAIIILLLLFSALYFISKCASQIGIFDKKIKLNKIALFSGEIDLGSGETLSLLNNCLDEIVYFFSRMESYRIVIFEDLDRLKNPDIFIKLREINKIVNNNLSNEVPLRFIYAVRDDIFSGADSRTKFFDFIIPVVPVMDDRNAFSLLNGKMKAMIPEGEECLRGTAVYISDMRTLHNIINEYLIFSEVVDNKNRNINLYAMVFYKNIFAHDYGLIDKKQSILYKIVYNYRIMKLHESYFIDLDYQISDLDKKMHGIIEEKASTKQDVRKSIVYSLIPENLSSIILFHKTNPNYNHYTNKFIPIDTQDLISNEQAFINLLTQSSSLYYGYISNNENRLIEITKKERDKLLENYQKRVGLVGEERQTSFKETQRQLKDAKEKFRRRKNISLAELILLIGREGFREITETYLQEIVKHDLISEEQKKAVSSEMHHGGFDALYLLLSRNYLDQDFMRSRSIFQEGGLSVNDNEFIKYIALGVPNEKANTELVIDDVDKVILEMSTQHLLHYEAAMHHQIVGRMLKNNDPQLDDMLATLFGKPAESVLTILNTLEARFSDPDSFPLLLVRALDKNRYLDLLIFQLNTVGDVEHFRRIAAEVVSLISPECSDNRSQYRRYIESLDTGIVHLFDPARVFTFLTHILSLKVCYENLTAPLSDTELTCLSFIGENSLYRLSRENIGIILSAQLSEHSYTAGECEQRPWTLAQEYSLAALDYFKCNADEFVREVFLQSEEKDAAIVAVLQLDSLSDEMKLSIAKNMNFCLDTLAEVPVKPECQESDQLLSFHDIFYHYDRVKASWPELINYISEACNMYVLTKFLARHAAELSTSMPKEIDGDYYDLLYMKIICNKALNEQDYKKVIANLEINTSFFNSSISDDIIIRLLQMDKIPLTRNDYLNVMNNISDLNSSIYDILASWLGRYQTELMSEPDYYLYNNDDISVFKNLISRMMHSTLLSDDNKMQLYCKYEDYYFELDEENINIPDEVKIGAFFMSSNEVMKIRIISSLIANNYRKRSVLALMADKLQENELKKIFSNKTSATLSLNDRNNCVPLLDKIQRAGLIKDYDLRDDGKVSVTIRSSATDGAE